MIAGVLEWRDPGLGSFPKEHRRDEALFEKLGEIGVPAAQRTLLLDDRATASAIGEALAGMVARADSEATLIFYFAEPDHLETSPAELRVTWENKVWNAKVREVDGGFMLITNPGYDSKWDEWIGDDRVVGHGHRQPAKGDWVKVEWKGRWYDAQVKSTQGGKFCIGYVGFDVSWDECVEEARIRF